MASVEEGVDDLGQSTRECGRGLAEGEEGPSLALVGHTLEGSVRGSVPRKCVENRMLCGVQGGGQWAHILFLIFLMAASTSSFVKSVNL